MFPTGTTIYLKDVIYVDHVYLDERVDIIFNTRKWYTFQSLVIRCGESDGHGNKSVCLKLQRSHTMKNSKNKREYKDYENCNESET